MRYLLFALLFILNSQAAPGCMDCSYHTQEPCDPKIEYLVVRQYGSVVSHCPCPCKKILPARGTCLDCGHIRYLKPGIMTHYDPCTPATPEIQLDYPKNLSLRDRAMMRILSKTMHKS